MDIINLDDLEITHATPEPLKKSSKEKRKKKRKKSAQQESDGRLVIRLKKAGPTQPAEAKEDEGRVERPTFWNRQLYIARRMAQFWPQTW
jgi:hypothetical protein